MTVQDSLVIGEVANLACGTENEGFVRYDAATGLQFCAGTGGWRVVSMEELAG